MQNRANRNLLFGSRSTAGGELPTTSSSPGSADTDALEIDNQRSVEQLRGSAGAIKDIALHIDADVVDQNRMLDRMDKRFDNANGLLAQTSNLLNEMVSDRTSSRTCGLIGVFFFLLVVLYFILKE